MFSHVTKLYGGLLGNGVSFPVLAQVVYNILAHLLSNVSNSRSLRSTQLLHTTIITQISHTTRTLLCDFVKPTSIIFFIWK